MENWLPRKTGSKIPQDIWTGDLRDHPMAEQPPTETGVVYFGTERGVSRRFTEPVPPERFGLEIARRVITWIANRFGLMVE